MFIAADRQQGYRVSRCCRLKSRKQADWHSRAAWNYGGPIVVSCIVTSGGSCDVAMLLLGLSESTRFLLSQKCIGRQCFLKANFGCH